MPKLRILQLAGFRWYNAPAHYALTVSKALAERGHSVHLGLTSPPDSCDVDYRSLEFPVHVLNLNFANPLSILASLKYLKRIIADNEIQIVNAHSANSHILAAALIGFNKSGFKLVRTRGEAHLPGNNFLNRHLYSSLTDLVIAPANTLSKAIRTRLKINHNNVKLIHLGIGPNNLTKVADPLKGELGILPGENVIGMVGRLSPVKGHVYLIRAAVEILKQHPRTKFIITAREAQISVRRLKQIAFDLGVLDKFVFLGEISNIQELISILDIGVVCSIGSETICRVLLEFMSAGKPVIGTKVNGIPEMIQNGQNGLLVEPQSSSQLALTVCKLLTDDRLRSEMGKKSLEMAESSFSLKHFAHQTERAYTELLGI